MTTDEMETFVAEVADDTRLAAFASHYVALAQAAVVAHLFPYTDAATWDDVPEKHHVRTCEIAVYLLNKRGAEGEQGHSENGVSRTYGSATIPSGYFDGMNPYVGVPA